ncbi:MAG: 1-deoxy-D-xylulose-5-phosphate reductoisomerase [Oscillospiraceae bacterium]|jgi:1-deoxy-D-xylulose-5-phosphate reductoisomerase|nr:1-deoxy-D-xylulose-5-phosphate reductoisomerase [Oscillospiraceae bacterium]
MNAISVLGSTGSIGTQTLEVAAQLKLPVAALAANRNIELLERQARRFSPKLIAVYDEDAARDLKIRLRDTNIRVASGESGLIAAAEAEAATVVTAVSGNIGLAPTLAAIGAGRRVALANKETLVCAGELVMRAAREKGAELIPVDSEHSAIFQCLQGQKEVKKLILTASGGPFRGKSPEELQNVTVEMTLKHPNWSMGKKVTVDSATMMNKGLELIEAMHLFSLPPERISVLVHPQSIVHSLVEFADNAVLAQLGTPDMRLPIQYALTYPARFPSLAMPLDLAAVGALTFEEPDTRAFPCLALAAEAAERGGTAGAILSAANEAAVALFLEGKIGFCRIYELARGALDRIGIAAEPSLGDIAAAAREASLFVERTYTCIS